jgi:hypothetical protein
MGHAYSQSYEVQQVKIGKGTEQVFASDHHNGQLYFCSNAKSKQAKDVVNEDNTRFLNLYTVETSEDFLVNKKVKPIMLSENVNSKMNEGPIFIDKKNNIAYFSSNLVTDTTAVSLVLYSAEYFYTPFSGFEKRKRVIIDLGDGNYSNPTISPDGNQMIFSFTSLTDTSSNLYMAKKVDGEWTEPKRLDICSDHNESFPRWCDNALYFASDRPDGYGGLDIYKSTYIDGQFGQPSLLPDPINSESDDFLFFYTASNVGYLSSNRSGMDRVFKFTQDLPTTSEFVESSVQFCYIMQDEIALNNDGYDYVWEFGDGLEGNGPTVEHCYQDTGVYEVSCHLLDVNTLEIEKNVMNGVVEVFSNYPIIKSSKLDNGSLEVYLEERWSRNVFTNHYWLVNEEVVSEEKLNINSSVSKPITVKVVLWNTDDTQKVIGVTKTINTGE